MYKELLQANKKQTTQFNKDKREHMSPNGHLDYQLIQMIN